MTAQSLNFGGHVSQNYEDYLGPFFFEPFAADLAKRLNFNGVGKVLELACGTGRLTKHIAATLPPEIEYIATDLNPDMIAVAKSKVASDQVKFSTADMLNLPFDKDSFDLVVCQFGLMLVPEHLKALDEIYRVLKPGGKVLFSTWSDLDYNRVWAIGDSVLESFLGKDRIVNRNQGPFSLGDQWLVLELLHMAKFSKRDSFVVINETEIDSAAHAAYGYIHGLPIGGLIQSKRPELLPEISSVLEQKLSAELGDHPLRTPQKALVFEATK